VSPEQADKVLEWGLTDRERQVLVHLAGGLTNKEIARRIGLAPNTVHDHVRNVCTKMDVHRRVDAAVKAAKAGLV
jgi:DNA-binding NarL/FixJ family response regulator